MKRSREFQYTGDQNSKKKQKRAKVMDESVEEVKVEKVGTGDGEIKEEEESREVEKMILDWITREWTKMKGVTGITSREGKNEGKCVQWCKYTVMRRRTGSLLDLAEKKGALLRQEDQGLSGTKSRQSIVPKQGRTRSRSESNLLKKLLNWNHINAERYFMDHDGLTMQ